VRIKQERDSTPTRFSIFDIKICFQEIFMLANKILHTSSKLTTKINNRHYGHHKLMFDIPNNMTVNGQKQWKSFAA